MWCWTRTWIRCLRETGMTPVPCQGPSKLLSGSFLIQAMCSSNGPRTVPLSYKLLEGHDSHPPLVFLHGLFGSKINFESEAKALAEQTGRKILKWLATFFSSSFTDEETEAAKVLTIDARNHRDSPSDPDCSYEAMSADVEALLLKLGLAPCVLLGHCMGGKTAMVLALRKPELVERLIPLDISPTVTTAFPKASTYIENMKSLKIPKELSFSKAQQLADEQLSQSIQNPRIRQYLLNNLIMVDGQYVWKVNSEVLSRQVDNLMDFPQIQGSYSGPTLFLRGANSPVIQPHDYPEIKRLFPQAQVLTIPKAGHWIHVDQPQDFLTSILNFLSSKLSSFQTSNSESPGNQPDTI